MKEIFCSTNENDLLVLGKSSLGMFCLIELLVLFIIHYESGIHYMWSIIISLFCITNVLISSKYYTSTLFKGCFVSFIYSCCAMGLFLYTIYLYSIFLGVPVLFLFSFYIIIIFMEFCQFIYQREIYVKSFENTITIVHHEKILNIEKFNERFRKLNKIHKTSIAISVMLYLLIPFICFGYLFGHPIITAKKIEDYGLLVSMTYGISTFFLLIVHFFVLDTIRLLGVIAFLRKQD